MTTLNPNINIARIYSFIQYQINRHRVHARIHMFNNITVLKWFFLAHIQKATQVTNNYCILSVKVFCGLYANFLRAIVFSILCVLCISEFSFKLIFPLLYVWSTRTSSKCGQVGHQHDQFVFSFWSRPAPGFALAPNQAGPSPGCTLRELLTRSELIQKAKKKRR